MFILHTDWFFGELLSNSSSNTQDCESKLSEYVCVCVFFQVIHLQKAELNRETVYLMHPSSIHGVEDMSTLAELHEAAIMHNLFLRYEKDNIYVSLNLSACSPCATIV